MTAKIKAFPGTPLSEKDFREGKILFNYDQLKGDFAWDTGVGIGKYLAGLKQGVITGSLCATCSKIVVPPRTVCEWCFNPMDEFVPLQDTGTVNTFSLCYVSWDVKRLTVPELPAVIQLEGASSLGSHPIMGGIMHKLGEVDPDEIHIGMRVQAVWKPPEERQGAVTDILYFKPI
ncbi:MAG: Zn-ribbon domain-containing OB-fold protein [Anaerolineales bacterium]|jgi:uncharacterized OB-fold protein|nr:Zn-ribbon domain-containing OB-fold protein [Anaerolineales bacterium]